MLAIYRQNEKKEWVLSTVFADNVAGLMWKEWFEKGGYVSITRTVRSVSELTDVLTEDQQIESLVPSV
jgi:hypothetical protein